MSIYTLINSLTLALLNTTQGIQAGKITQSQINQNNHLIQIAKETIHHAESKTKTI